MHLREQVPSSPESAGRVDPRAGPDQDRPFDKWPFNSFSNARNVVGDVERIVKVNDLKCHGSRRTACMTDRSRQYANVYHGRLTGRVDVA